MWSPAGATRGGSSITRAALPTHNFRKIVVHQGKLAEAMQRVQMHIARAGNEVERLFHQSLVEVESRCVLHRTCELLG